MRTIRCILYILLMIYWGTIAYLTHVPRLPRQLAQVNDKTAHLLSYGALAGLTYVCIWTVRPRWKITPILVVLLAMAYGAIDEQTQPYFGRTCDLRDWLADLTGASIAAASLFAVQLTVMRRFTLAPARTRPSDQD